MSENDVVHSNVRLLRRYFVYNLESEAYTDFISVDCQRQKSVVISFATSKSVTVNIESHSGNNGQFDVLVG